ncbi:ribonuclease III domain-containing protein [Eubacterium sp. 1001713B170207_170306_E7]|uniref:Mini-ribonuclease 3 n=1 Tax=Eubacterium sp. 1001713B170207_170306_E7 TaxID=2787097 RepID=UPI001899481D|nr:ribonuclease III domain-containing protein [Eubacterium sp. 1001713B170207_170306_E7]
MEESVKQRLHKKYTIAEARALNPLTLAYIGDGVYSEYIRRFLVSGGISNVNHLTKESIKYVRADGQSKMVLALMDSLTDEELDIVRRGRNTRSHVPKHARTIDYRYATGLEALIGYLELTGQEDRLEALMVRGIGLLSE